MYIDYEDIHKFKRVNLADIFKSYGHTLKKTQTGYVTNCSFHNDNEYSLSINRKNEVWLWHCRHCRIGGTAIDLVMRKESLSLRETYIKLKERLERSATPASSYTVCDQKLIKYVLEYYEDVFKNKRNAQGLLLDLGLTESSIFRRFRIGYSDGTLPRQKVFVPNLKEIGILNKKNEETLQGFIVFALEDTDKNVTALVGVSKNKTLYPGKERGVFGARSFKASKRIYLAKDIIEALSLYQAGIHEVVALGENERLEDDHLRYMKENLTKEIVISSDTRGKDEIKKTLRSKLAITCLELALPKGIHGINQWLRKGMTKEFVLKSITLPEKTPDIKPLTDAAKEAHVATPKPIATDDDIYLSFEGKRHYRIRGLDLSKVGTLKANVKLATDRASHLDTFDLTSSMSRERFKRMSKKLLEIEESIIHKDLSDIIEKLEELQSKHLEAKRKKSYKDPRLISDEEKIKALEYLKDRRLLERLLEDFHKSGYVGEDTNLLIGYIVATSRKLENPLSILVISRSASGKSSLQDAVLSFIPPEDVIKYTRLTDQSLFYHEEDSLFKKVLAIEEEQGAMGAGYAIRNVITSKVLKTGSTIKDPETGILKNQNTSVRLQTSVFLTTTKQSLDSETMNRFIVATIDESRSQTERILSYQRRLFGEEGYKLTREKNRLARLHANIQRMIEPIEVVNPYQDKLTFTTKTLRARREQFKYLTLINTIALIRQHQKRIRRRPDGSEYIEVELFDIEKANELAKIYLAKSLDYVSPPARNLYKELKKMIRSLSGEPSTKQNECLLSRRNIMEYTGWSEWQVRNHMQELVDLEYVIPVHGSQGKRYSYKLVEDVDYDIPHPDIGVRTPTIEPFEIPVKNSKSRVFVKTS